MIRGETVLVSFFEEGKRDAHNNPDPGHGDPIAVDNVLVAPAAASDVIDSVRPDGRLIRYTLYFPKTFTDDLTKALVKVRDDTLPVVGSPRPWCPDMTPGQWNLVVQVGDVDG